jgi:hypothetical protein
MKTKIIQRVRFFGLYIVENTADTTNYLTISALNKKGAHKEQQLAELEASGNHCAIK